MDDDNQINQGASDEKKLAELEDELEEIEEQKKVGESEQGVGQNNQRQEDSKSEKQSLEPATFDVKLQEKTKQSVDARLSRPELQSRKKSSKLYYAGIALMISSLALLVLNYFLGN